MFVILNGCRIILVQIRDFEKLSRRFMIFINCITVKMSSVKVKNKRIKKKLNLL